VGELLSQVIMIKFTKTLKITTHKNRFTLDLHLLLSIKPTILLDILQKHLLIVHQAIILVMVLISLMVMYVVPQLFQHIALLVTLKVLIPNFHQVIYLKHRLINRLVIYLLNTNKQFKPKVLYFH
jgi:hypothetical protein